MSETLTDTIAQYAAACSYAALPNGIAERSKKIIFDEVACALVGSQLVSGRLIARFVDRMGGVPEATMYGASERVPVALAALANGTAGHADEFDGAHITDGHPGAVIVHSVLTVAEMAKASGKDVINGVALGYDVGTRLVEATGGAFVLRKAHAIHSDHLHSFGAAIAGARILDLDVAKIRYAAALAAGHAGGLAVVFEERRHMTKALSTGQSAYAGATAAVMSSIGFEGHDSVFDSQYGPMRWRSDNSDARFDDLGSDYAVMGANFKFYSAGYPIHAPAEAAIRIVEENGIDPASIIAIQVYTTTANIDVVSNRDMPSICIEDMLGVAIVNRALGLDVAHSSTALADPEARRLRSVVRCIPDTEMDAVRPRLRGARVVIETSSGQSFECSVRHPKGHALRGDVAWSDLHGKWDGLLPRFIGDRAYEAFRSTCSTLDQLEDVSTLLAGLRMDMAGTGDFLSDH